MQTNQTPGEREVEALARALAKADGKDPDTPAWVQSYGKHEQTFGVCWRDQYADKARAALAAMQRPLQKGGEVTEAMIEAGRNAAFECVQPVSRRTVKAIYRAMTAARVEGE